MVALLHGSWDTIAMALLFWALVFGAPIVALGFFIRFAYLRFVKKRQDVEGKP